MTRPLTTPLELFVPAPCDWISANAREHWAPRAKRTRWWRHAAGIVARNSRARIGERVDVQFDFHKAPGPNRRWDPANLAPTGKAILDGIVDAEILADDDTRHVRYVAYADGGRRDRPGVTITITPTQETV